MSKYLDEYVVGERFVSSARTVTESDVVNFACMTGDMHPNHTDAAAMEHSIFGKRIAHGLLGLSWAHGFLYRLDLITESAIAFLAIEDWKFLKPIFSETPFMQRSRSKRLCPAAASRIVVS